MSESCEITTKETGVLNGVRQWWYRSKYEKIVERYNVEQYAAERDAEASGSRAVSQSIQPPPIGGRCWYEFYLWRLSIPPMERARYEYERAAYLEQQLRMAYQHCVGMIT